MRRCQQGVRSFERKRPSPNGCMWDYKEGSWNQKNGGIRMGVTVGGGGKRKGCTKESVGNNNHHRVVQIVVPDVSVALRREGEADGW